MSPHEQVTSRKRWREEEEVDELESSDEEPARVHRVQKQVWR